MSTSSPDTRLDCGQAYVDFLNKLLAETNLTLSPEQLVRLHRRALRVYDACETGDLEDAQAQFERLDEMLAASAGKRKGGG
jgi:hypothetical protein